MANLGSRNYDHNTKYNDCVYDYCTVCETWTKFNGHLGQWKY